MIKKPSEDFLKQEYSEISKYIVEIVRTRFVVFGAFLAGAITLLSTTRPLAAYAFGLIAVICVIMIDLRNRVLLAQLCLRAIAIENDFMIGPPGTPLPFWMLQTSNDVSFLALAGVNEQQLTDQHIRWKAAHQKSIRILGLPLPRFTQRLVRHSFAMDFAYLGFCAAMFWELLKRFILNKLGL